MPAIIPKRPNFLVLLALLLFPGIALAQTSSPDVGLVTKLAGEVTYRHKDEQKKPARAQAFMKVRKDDHFQLPPGSSLQVLYFAGGRQETWTGPVILIAGEAESAPKSGKQPASPPEVKIMPARAAKTIAAASLPLPRSGACEAGATQVYRSGPGRSGTTPVMEMGPGRSGAIRTMAPACPTPPRSAASGSPEARLEIKEAEGVYQELRQKADADDVTPELYFLGVLANYRQFGEMDRVIDTMLKKRPGDRALKDLKAWARSQAAGAAQPPRGNNP